MLSTQLAFLRNLPILPDRGRKALETTSGVELASSSLGMVEKRTCVRFRRQGENRPGEAEAEPNRVKHNEIKVYHWKPFSMQSVRLLLFDAVHLGWTMIVCCSNLQPSQRISLFFYFALSGFFLLWSLGLATFFFEECNESVSTFRF